MNLPQLPSQPIRPELQNEDAEIWQPSWKCFCCQDRGIVQSHLVRLVIPDYNHSRDRLPICQSSECKQGSKWLHLDSANIKKLLVMLCRVKLKLCCPIILI
jgi:hypothetical protein